MCVPHQVSRILERLVIDTQNEDFDFSRNQYRIIPRVKS